MTEMLWVLPPGEKGQATALNLGIDWQTRNNRHTIFLDKENPLISLHVLFFWDR